MLTDRQRQQLLGLGLLTLAVFTALSLVPVSSFAPETFPDGSIMGVLGRVVRDAGIRVFGIGVLLIPVLLAVAGAAGWGWLERATAARQAALALGLLVLLPAVAALGGAAQDETGASLIPVAAAGWIGNTIAVPLVALLSPLGAFLFLGVLLIALSIATIGWNPVAALGRGGRAFLVSLRRPPLPADSIVLDAAGEEDVPAHGDNGEAPASAVRAARRAGMRRRADPLSERVPPAGQALAELPPITLLSEPPARDASVAEGELDRLGEVLIRTLRTFKVEGRIVGRTTGPVVTQFEVEPAPGVKVNRIAALDADLALALRAPSIRIVAPIPGKGAVGVEVPNPEPEIVHLRRMLEAAAFQRTRADLPIALGRDLTGKPFVADLARMPHLLIAGATGTGKSVCINAIITSLVFRHSPASLRLLLIDPKMVELSIYGNLPHLRHPVVKNPHDAARVLKWAVMQMERRYELLSANGARSITEFNRKLADGESMRLARADGPEEEPASWRYTEGPLPHIVVIIDELADLIMTLQAEVERPLAQLAQKARAIGIHLIIATQRPSVNVITGLIKANFPCRIAFRVVTKVDSRTILDQNGADALLGNGDLLFLPPGASDPVRIQGAYISTEDTEQLMGWYGAAAPASARPAAEDDIIEVVRAQEQEEEQEDLALPEERDVLFRQAAEICIQHQQGSTSLLQRRLRVGYGRAARIIDQLYTAGILGPPDGSKPREVLVGLESLDHVAGED